MAIVRRPVIVAPRENPAPSDVKLVPVADMSDGAIALIDLSSSPATSVRIFEVQRAIKCSLTRENVVPVVPPEPVGASSNPAEAPPCDLATAPD
jgi:hypothetical protein